jgi:hypothetical protein
MGCKTLTPPEPPEIDASKLSNVSLPDGVPSVDALKAKAQNPGISDKLKAAGDGIASNIKDKVSGFSPSGIADKVKGAVTGIIGGVKDQITGVIDGAKNAFNNIKNFKPGLPKLNNPASAFEAAKAKGLSSNLAKIGGRQNLRANALCGNKFNQEAGKVNNSINSKATDFTKGLTSSDKRKMKTDPTFAQEKVDEGIATTTAGVQAETEAAVNPTAGEDKEDRDIQSKTQSDYLETLTKSGDCAPGYTLNLLKCMNHLLMHSYFWMDATVRACRDIHKSTKLFGGDGYYDVVRIAEFFVEQHVRDKLISGLKTVWEKSSGCEAENFPTASAIWPPDNMMYADVICTFSKIYRDIYWSSPYIAWTRQQIPKKGKWWGVDWDFIEHYFLMWKNGRFMKKEYLQYGTSPLVSPVMDKAYPNCLSEFENIVERDEFHDGIFAKILMAKRAEALGVEYKPHMIVVDYNDLALGCTTPWPSNFIVTATFGKDGIVKNVKTGDPDPFLQSLDWS